MRDDPGGNKPRQINLALQGGGSHGAFTWGVLHRLMSDRRIRIEGLSGTSAGAMNAVIFTYGFLTGKRQGAIDILAEFWERVSRSGHKSVSFGRWPSSSKSEWNLDETPMFALMDMVTRMFSPYELNPLNVNPLRDIIDDLVDFELLRSRKEMKLFVTATNVKTSKPKVFRTPELTTQALLASACVPTLFKAVEIDGEFYWDGGYMGNPSIYPLIHECKSNDVLIVQINPLTRDEVPTRARDILNRITELSFNSSLVREMRGFTTITGLIDSGHLSSDLYSRVNFHMIDAEKDLPQLGVSSKFNTDKRFLDYLHDLGFEAAGKWLEDNFDKIGVESSVDVFKTFV
jgi:NTE family protein